MTNSQSQTIPRLGITMGDPNGIGPEVIVKSLQRMSPFNGWTPLIFGDLAVLHEVNETLQTSLEFRSFEGSFSKDKKIDVVDLAVQEDRDWCLGKMCAWGGESAHRFLTTAIEWTKEEKTHAIVTAPLCKESLHAAKHFFPGHTEMLSHYTNKARPVMMLAVDNLRAIHVTTHMALREAIEWLTADRILEVIEIAHDALLQLGITSPRIGVPGLNPHAGENGLFGTEEKDIIVPAIESARKKGIQCEGPYPPDTIFLHHRDGRLDAVIALYHDQGFIPLKLIGFDRGVNVTLGLPIIRTSVDHGTAFDRAPEYNANPNSMICAIDMAIRMVRNRHSK